MKNLCVHFFQCVTSRVVITVSAGVFETAGIDFTFLHCMHDFQLIVLCHFVDGIKTFF